MTSATSAIVLQRVRELRAEHPLVLVSIDGAGGAGKSTLARSLEQSLGADVAVIAMDDFIVRDHVLDHSWEHAWDRARLRAQVLEPLTRGEPVRFQRFDWERNALGDTVELAAAPVVIVEGITSQHPALDDYWHLRVWVDTPPDLARDRGRERDGENENAQYWDLWAANDARYRVEHSPNLRAHLVVPGA